MGILDTLRSIGAAATKATTKVGLLATGRPQTSEGIESARQSSQRFTKSIETPFARKQVYYRKGKKVVKEVPYITRQRQTYTTGGIKYTPSTPPKSKTVRGAGRPRQSFKLQTDPLTGRLVRMPAPLLYKRARLARRLASAQLQRTQLQKFRMYQQRGISPEQAAQIELMKQQRMAQMQMPRQMPQIHSQMPQVQRFPVQQRFAYPQQFQQQQMAASTDFFRGGMNLRPKEAWLR